MRLLRFLVRYFPPCLCLEYRTTSGKVYIKEIPLPTLGAATDVQALADQLVTAEPLLSSHRTQQVVRLLRILQARQHSISFVAPGHLASMPSHRCLARTETLRPHALPITNIALSKCGCWLVSASYDRTCKITMLTREGELSALPVAVLGGRNGRSDSGDNEGTATPIEAHGNAVFAVAVNAPHDTLVATGGFDKRVLLWDLRGAVRDCEAAAANYTRGSLTSRGISCASSCECSAFAECISASSVAAQTQTQARRGSRSSATAHTGEVVCLAFAAGGQKLATGSMDGTVRLWDVGTGCKQACAQLALLDHGAEVSCLGFADCAGEDGGPRSSGSPALFATGAFDAHVRLWCERTGDAARKLAGHGGPISAVAINHTGDLVLSGSTDGTCRLWDVGSGRTVFTLGRSDGGEVTDACFNPTGTQLVVARSGGFAEVFDCLTGVRLALLDPAQSAFRGGTNALTRAVFSPSGETVVTAGSDGALRVWRLVPRDAAAPNEMREDIDIRNSRGSSYGAECVQVLRGHTDEVFSTVFSYSGEQLISVSKDNTCNVWRAQRYGDIFDGKETQHEHEDEDRIYDF